MVSSEVITDARTRYLAYLSSWATEHQEFLDVICADFLREGLWPDVNQLERTRRKETRTRLDLIDVAGQVPILIGLRDYNSNRVRLTLRGLAACPMASEVLGDFVSAVKLCFGLWDGSPTLPKVNRDEFRDHLGLSGPRLDRLEAVFQAEGLIHEGLSIYADGKWEVTVSDHIRRFETVQRIQEYLEIQGEMLVSLQLLMQHGFITPQGKVAAPSQSSEAADAGPCAGTWMFEDITGSKKLTRSLGNAAFAQLRSQHDDVVRAAIKSHAGREENHNGDGFLLNFGTPRLAVACALQLGSDLAKLNLRLHIGMHSGEAVRATGQVSGEAVNIARQAMDSAKPYGIRATTTVMLQLLGSEFSFVEEGSLDLGNESSISLYSVHIGHPKARGRSAGAGSQVTDVSAAAEAHVDDLRRVAESLIRDVDANRPPRFSPDSDAAKVMRQAFDAHFSRAGKQLRDSTTVLARDSAASVQIVTRVNNETVRLEAEHGLNVAHTRAVLTRAVESQLTEQAEPVPIPVAFSISAHPDLGFVLFLGGSGVASSHVAHDLTEAQSAFEHSVSSIVDWPELTPARQARLDLAALKHQLRQGLIEIAHLHRLAASHRCHLCSP